MSKTGEFVYKIRFPNGEYSLGGMIPFKNARGKIWKEWSHLKNHLGLIWENEYRKSGRNSVYERATAVTYYMLPVKTTVITGLTTKPSKDTIGSTFVERLRPWTTRTPVTYKELAKTLREEADRIEAMALADRVDS